jgi:hypothetical protein
MDTPKEKARNSVLLITTLLLVGISLTLPWYKFSELWLTSDVAGVHVNKDTTIYFLHGSRIVVAYDNYQTVSYEGYDPSEPSGMGYYMRNEGVLLIAWAIFCWVACMLYVSMIGPERRCMWVGGRSSGPWHRTPTS